MYRNYVTHAFAEAMAARRECGRNHDNVQPEYPRSYRTILTHTYSTTTFNFTEKLKKTATLPLMLRYSDQHHEVVQKFGCSLPTANEVNKILTHLDEQDGFLCFWETKSDATISVSPSFVF